MTPNQRTLITDLLVAELTRMTANAVAGGAGRASVDAERGRRCRTIRNSMPPKLSW